MSLVSRKGLALAVSTAVVGLSAFPGSQGRIASAAEPLYVLGPESAVAKALDGGPVRACAPAIVSLPENFEHLRTPPGETARAVALRICEVMVVQGIEVEGASRALTDLDVAVDVAPLAGQATVVSVSEPRDGGVILASTGPATQLAATPSEDAEALFYQGYEALQQDRIDASIDLFERGLRMSPTNHVALFYLGTAYEAANQPARARPLYERVSALAPDSQEAAQARERLAALRASGTAGSSSGRFATGIFIDPAAPPEKRSIRDVFEQSPMAAGDRQAGQGRSQELPALPPLETRAAPRIQAPAVPAPEETVQLPERAVVEADRQRSATAAAAGAPPAEAPVSRPRLSSRGEPGSIGTGRLSTRLGASRVPPPESLEVGTAEAGTAPRPDSRQEAAGGESLGGLPWSEDREGVEEARLSEPGSAVVSPSPQESGRIELGRGAVYVGPVEAGRPHGRGRIAYPDGSTYEGMFQSGERTGTGSFVSADGWRYDGEFRNGRFDGRGTLVFADGGTYAGEFRDGARTGTGVYTWPSGARYEGEFEDGVIVGSGVYVAADGTRYDGEFVEGRRSGEGTLTLTDGRIYVGRMADGLPQGRGSFYWPDGRRFAGEFSNGAADGAGTMVYPDGRSESGVWTSEPLMADLVRVSQ